MSDDLSITIFASDFEDAKKADDASRWSFDHRGGLEVWVTVSPRDYESEQFIVRLLWTRYPDEPPSVKFVDTKTGALGVAKAWPIARGFRPPSDICATWTLEGFLAHPEWKNDPLYKWDSHGNVLLKTMRILQEELDETYQGRSQS